MARLRDLSEEQKDLTLDWIESLPQHPEYGREFKKLLVKADPRTKSAFPDVEMQENYEKKAQEQEEKINKFLEAQKDRENKAFWEGKRKAAQDAGFVKPEETPDFEKWMVEEHLGNYERAAKIWHDEKHAAAEPTNYVDTVTPTLPSQEGLYANPIQWARNEAGKAINDIRKGRGTVI
jgi:hypothetical protein